MKLIIELKDETYKFFKENVPILIARGNGKVLTGEVYEAIKNGKLYDEAEVWRKSNELLEKRLKYLGNPKDRWILVSERLPEEYGSYLVTIEYIDERIITITKYSQHGWFLEGVTAWRELPKPYESTRKRG